MHLLDHQLALVAKKTSMVYAAVHSSVVTVVENYMESGGVQYIFTPK